MLIKNRGTNTIPELYKFCIVQEHREFSQQRCYSFVCDVTKDWSQAPFKPQSLGTNSVPIIYILKLRSTMNNETRTHVSLLNESKKLQKVKFSLEIFSNQGLF